MLEGIIILALISIGGFAFFFVNRAKAKGRFLAIVLDRGKKAKFVTFVPNGNLFTFSKGHGRRKTDDETYIIDAGKVVLVRYPFSGPDFLKSDMPCSIYSKNNPEALDPADVTVLPKGRTAKDVASVLDETVLRNVVKAGAASGKKEKIPAWIVSAVCVCLVLIVLVVLYMMYMKMSGMQASINMLGG